MPESCITRICMHPVSMMGAIRLRGGEQQTMQTYFLMTMTYLATLMDVMTGRISNILTGLGCMAVCITAFFEGGMAGLLECFMGVGVMAAILFPFFLFRMIGAGDVKLLMMIGGAVGPNRGLDFLFLVVLFGGVISVGIFVSGSVSVKARAEYFLSYCKEFIRTGKRQPYRRKRGKENYPFSVPILLAVIYFLKC